MFKKSMFTLTVLAVAGVAHAQPAGVAAAPAELPDSGLGEIYHKGTLGFSFPVTLLSNVTAISTLTAEPVPTVDVLYFLSDKVALDLIVGFNVHHFEKVDNSTPPMTTSTTVFGLAVGLGYRMYMHKGGKLHSYLEPAALVTWGDTSQSSALGIRLAAALGAERDITDWFTFSGAVGAALDFGNSFKNILLSPTATLAANFYWK
jgi:hypothetical protein